MKLKVFGFFVAPSVIIMFLLIAAPLVGVGYLSVFNSYTKTKIVEIKSSLPLIGGLVQETTQKVSQPVLDEEGNPIQVWEYVGSQNISDILGVKDIQETVHSQVDSESSFTESASAFVNALLDVDFWRALEFTLLYVFLTTPFVLILGFLIALAVNSATQYLRGALIFASLLPFIITPVVGSLSIYWLFLDNAVVSSVLQWLGFGKIYFLKDAFSIRSLIITYGVWHVTPFAFVVLYAGLQTLPQDSLEAAIVDGASKIERIRYVVIPHLKPLFIFVALIHIMDAYRIFEPVLVFGSNLYANSLQYLTYDLLNAKDNFHKAAASALLNVLGIMILMIPIVKRTLAKKDL
jgi:multiple sugar transport system permease protein